MAAARDLYRTELMHYLRRCQKVVLWVHDFDPLGIFFLLILLDDKILCFCSGCYYGLLHLVNLEKDSDN